MIAREEDICIMATVIGEGGEVVGDNPSLSVI